MSAEEDFEEVPSLREGDEDELDEVVVEGDYLDQDDEDIDEIDSPGQGPGTIGAYSEESVNDQVFEELSLPPALTSQVQLAWQGFLGASERHEAAGEAIYSAFFDAAPSLQSLFTTPRAVMAMKFVYGINTLVQACGDPRNLKVTVEALGFRHLDMEVTIPRVILFRDAIVDLINVELNGNMSHAAISGFRILFNYVGGAFIYIRTMFADRLKVIQSSWASATRKGLDDKGETAAPMDLSSLTPTTPDEFVIDIGGGGEHHQKDDKAGKYSFFGRGRKSHNKGGAAQGHESKSEVTNAVVPKTYHDMFIFNAAVMGFGSKVWMHDILTAFDPIVTHVANTQRLQEECDVLALSMSKHHAPIVLSEYKAVMLASLRSLVREWDSQHELAWSWLWENVERMFKAVLHKPAVQQKALEVFYKRLDETAMQFVRREVYVRFFAMAPTGQDYFKQSTTRLHFIVDRMTAMTMDMYTSPKSMVNDLSAMGLRHVGYGIPIEMFNPFVTSAVQTVRQIANDEQEVEAFSWSLNLVSRILCRVISEGSTIVMKAINVNSPAMLRKAVGCAPRGERAAWVLNVQVGTQSISPLLWAIQTGSLDASKAIIIDLLTIRADRDNYYFGADFLFERHPDIIRRLTLDAPALMPTFLDGFIWRSRNTENGYRRVNYWIKHFLVDAEGNFSQNIDWLVKFNDPKLICHPVATMAVDMVWNRVAFRTFLLGKTWFLFTTIIFICSQSILTHATASKNGDRLSMDGRVTMLVFRHFIYIFSMGEMIVKQSKLCIKDIRQKNFAHFLGIPYPEYLNKWQNACSFALMWCLILMFCVEPIVDCLTKGPSENFTRAWCRGEPWRFTYALLSTLSILLYFILMSDFTVLSTRVSAFTLVCSRLVTELFLFLFGTSVFSVAFACAISALRQEDEHFDNSYDALLHLWKIPLGMLSPSIFDEMEDVTPALFVAIAVYYICICIFFLSLFVAQLSSAYQATFADMVGYARLNRGQIVVATMASVPEFRWHTYIESLHLDRRIEFGEGDIGLAGGVQVWEPGSLNPTTEEKVKRFAGTTSREAPWPNEETKSEEDLVGRFDKFEKMMEKSMKKMQKMMKGGTSTSSRLSSSAGGSVQDNSGDGPSGSNSEP